MRLPAAVSLVLALALPAAAHAADVYVDPAQLACSDAAGAVVAGNPSTPWCSPAPALRLAQPGDVVHLAAATYAVQLRPATSGLPGQPIVYQADGPVVVAAPAGTVSVMLMGVHDIVLRGLTVRATALQAVWIDASARVSLDAVTVTNSAGTGVQIKGGTSISISNSQLVGNARAGLMEMTQAVGTVLSASLVSGNGKDGQPYNGDGVDLNGANGSVVDCTITGNGDGAGTEHGVYAGPSARGYTIARNVIGANAGADVKAAGGPGLVAANRLGSSLFGIVVSDNPALVTFRYNLVQGRFQHGILVTAGTTPARAQLWNNTVQQTGRSTASGNASAVFVVAAAQLETRNNLFAYTGADLLGSAFLLNDATRVGSFSADANWYASPDPGQRRVAWNGSRVTFAQWQVLSGGDAAGFDSAPPQFDASGRVVSVNLGAGRGIPLGLTSDLAGTPVPAFGPPDIGAFQHLP